MAADPFCDDCGGVDDLQHYFVMCPQLSMFWYRLSAALNCKLRKSYRLQSDSTTVLFGTTDGPRSLNIVMLYAKQFIVSKKFSDGDVDFDGFKKYLCTMFEIEKRVAIWNDKKDAFREVWKPFISDSLQLEL